VEQAEELVVAGVLVHEVDEGEVHRVVCRVSVEPLLLCLASPGAIAEGRLTDFAS